MQLSHTMPWRGTTVLGALVSALAAVEAGALPGGSIARAIPANATALANDMGQVLTVPLKRVNHRGVATPSIGKRLAKTDVLGVFGAAYLAECMSPISSIPEGSATTSFLFETNV